MREAVGGTLLINIMLIFIAIYIAFLAVAINYSMAFKVKNHVISIIEENEGYPGHNNEAVARIDEFLATIGYAPHKMQNEEGEYTIETKVTPRGTYYVVTTYIAFDVPIIGLDFRFPIKGETRIMINR
jgi:hypothetical protein